MNGNVINQEQKIDFNFLTQDSDVVLSLVSLDRHNWKSLLFYDHQFSTKSVPLTRYVGGVVLISAPSPSPCCQVFTWVKYYLIGHLTSHRIADGEGGARGGRCDPFL